MEMEEEATRLVSTATPAVSSSTQATPAAVATTRKTSTMTTSLTQTTWREETLRTSVPENIMEGRPDNGATMMIFICLII